MIRDILKSIKWYANFIIGLFITYPRLKKAKKLYDDGKIEEFRKYSYEETSKWTMKRIKDSGAKIEVFGKENIPKDRNVLFVSNHQGDFDIAIIMCMMEKTKAFVAKIELKKIPILRKWMEYTNCIFIDRKDMKQSLKSINEAIKLLKQGQSMVIFPEGTRSKSNEIGEFKAGSFKLATKTNVPIVPITMNGSYKIKEGNKNMIKPANVSVYIHKPIYMEDLSKEEKDNLPNTVKKIIEEKLLK